MSKKVVFITGGSSGIGKSIGEYLLNKSYSVYGTSRSPEKYSDSKFPLLSLDMKDVASISNAISEVVDKEGKIDILVNNAGAGITNVEEVPMDAMKDNSN